MTGTALPPSPIGLHRLIADVADIEGVPDFPVQGLSLDSRALGPGFLFAALNGHTVHGLRFADQAVRQGCAAIVFDPAGAGQSLALNVSAVPCVPVADLGHKLGRIADRFFGEPSRDLTIIGITGTNGKTSCSHFLAESFAAAGRPAAVLGTLGWGRPGSLAPGTHTTPDAIGVHRMLHGLRGEGLTHVAMEASSHGLEQGRLEGVRFRGALFTNFTRDHLDYHGTMEAYLDAKMRLLAWPGLEFAVYNANDPIGAAVLERLPAGLPALGFAVGGNPRTEGPLLRIGSVLHEPEGVSFEARYEGRAAGIRAPVFGDFNVENLTASLAVLLAMGYALGEAAALVANVKAVPGRMESCSAGGRTVVVDYAHTPDALGSVLRSLRRHCGGRLWAIFGCGGDRDRGKRPEMGAIAADIADVVVLTDDNPRSEDGDAIIHDILEGCGGCRPIIRRDRREAIRYALENAAPGDLVLVAGKGHETTQEVKGIKTPFSDRETVRDLLKQLGAMPT
jgi:UDP-N-acetylmuramoyl-L-alanyl-D-glutamate--2,6-diaminopimelate ligase